MFWFLIISNARLKRPGPSGPSTQPRRPWAGLAFEADVMPDFERFMDQFEIDMEDDPIEKARLRGVVAGKTRARLEIAGFAVLAAAVWLLATWLRA